LKFKAVDDPSMTLNHPAMENWERRGTPFMFQNTIMIRFDAEDATRRDIISWTALRNTDLMKKINDMCPPWTKKM